MKINELKRAFVVCEKMEEKSYRIYTKRKDKIWLCGGPDNAAVGILRRRAVSPKSRNAVTSRKIKSGKPPPETTIAIDPSVQRPDVYFRIAQPIYTSSYGQRSTCPTRHAGVHRLQRGAHVCTHTSINTLYNLIFIPNLFLFIYQEKKCLVHFSFFRNFSIQTNNKYIFSWIYICLLLINFFFHLPKLVNTHEISGTIGNKVSHVKKISTSEFEDSKREISLRDEMFLLFRIFPSDSLFRYTYLSQIQVDYRDSPWVGVWIYDAPIRAVSTVGLCTRFMTLHDCLSDVKENSLGTLLDAYLYTRGEKGASLVWDRTKGRSPRVDGFKLLLEDERDL